MIESRPLSRWYVLRSKPHKEAVLCRHSRASGHDVFYPTIPLKPVNPRAAKVGPYFPGYMFIRTVISEVGESVFHWMPFSAGLVHVGGEPAAVPEATVRAIAARVGQIWAAGGLQMVDYKAGEALVIREGAFEGYQAIFDVRLPGTERVRVLLRMLNDRFVPLEIEAALLERRPAAVAEAVGTMRRAA
jgi:transcriptional antiterminator RfaH